MQGQKNEGKRIKREALSMMTRPGQSNIDTETEPMLSEGLVTAIGKEVRNLRLSLNMAGNELAAKSGISNGMISKLERGSLNPSLTTLLAVSQALNVPISRLFAGHDTRADFSLVPAGQGIEVQRRGSKLGFTFQLLGHLLSGDKYIEPYMVTITEDAIPNRGFQHTGIELMYILEGAMLYRYADALVELRQGDTMVFDSNYIHGHEKIIEGPVKFMSIVFNIRS